MAISPITKELFGEREVTSEGQMLICKERPNLNRKIKITSPRIGQQEL
jgi:hypothetical protein